MDQPGTYRAKSARRQQPPPQPAPQYTQRGCVLVIIGIFIVLFLGVLGVSITMLVLNNNGKCSTKRTHLYKEYLTCVPTIFLKKK